MSKKAASSRGSDSSMSSIVPTIKQAIAKGDGVTLARFMYSEDILDSLVIDQRSIESESLKLDAQFKDIFQQRMMSIKAFNENDFSSAYEHEVKTLSLLIDLYSQKKDSFTQSLIKHSIFKSLRINHKYATKADNVDTSGEQYKLRSKYFNALFSIYRQKKIDIIPKPAYNLALKNICASYPFAAINISPWYKESDDDPMWRGNAFREFPVNDVCNFAFNCGRAKMLEDNYEKAVKWLNIALQSSDNKNKFRILALLIPMQMCVGKMPEKIIVSYGHKDMYDLSLAIRRGDVYGFENIMTRLQRTFVKIGIYLALEKLKLITYRNFFKRIQIARVTNNIFLDEVLPVLNNLGVEVDLGELECILSNLIHSGAIKGHLSTSKDKRRFLILKKDGAFPLDKCVAK